MPQGLTKTYFAQRAEMQQTTTIVLDILLQDYFPGFSCKPVYKCTSCTSTKDSLVETRKSSNLGREKSGNFVIIIPQSVLIIATANSYTSHSCNALMLYFSQIFFDIGKKTLVAYKNAGLMGGRFSRELCLPLLFIIKWVSVREFVSMRNGSPSP